MWTDLSMKDKSDLMSLFLKQGISSLSDMRRIYDGEQDTPANDTTKVENINRYNNPTLLKYAGTNVEPIIRDYRYFAKTPQEAAKFLAERNITENRDVVDYFNSYVNSEGYKRIQQNQSDWWKQRHPYKKYIDLGLHKEGAKELKNTVNKVDKNNAIRVFNLDTYSNLSFFVPNSGNAYIGNVPTIRRYPNVTYSLEPTYVTGHEVAHKYNGNLETLMGAQREALQYKINTKITGNKDADEHHDNYLDEIHSDVWGLKYLLFKEGIYDSRSNKDITIEEIKKLREKYPNLRPLMQSTDEELVWRLNHIASLDKKINTENLAAFGGRLYDGEQDINDYQVSLDNYSKYKNRPTFTTEDLNIKPADINYKELALRQRYAESSFNNNAVSNKGAKGAYGIMPHIHKWYVEETGDTGDLTDLAYNTRIRDWLMERNLRSDIHSSADTDSVRVGKLLVQHNYGSGNTRRRLKELEEQGIDTHTSFEWLDYFPKEPREYTNFVLRNKDINQHKNTEAFNKALKILKK